VNAMTKQPSRTSASTQFDQTKLDEAGTQLRELLGIPFSGEQLAAITAPLQPNVIIAGAGSGKTTVMAARVVWLVASGQIRPDQVLGLTFTRKAAAELSDRVAAALQQAGVVDRFGADDAGEQLIMTYDAFAGRLVSDHGLRIGAESDRRLITGATRFRLAGQVVAQASGPFQYLTRLRPSSLTERVLYLDEQLSQHLISDAELIDWTDAFAAELAQAPSYRGKPYAQVRNAIAVAGERLELLELVGDYRAAKQEAGVLEFHDQMAIAAQLAERVPQVGWAMREQFRVVLLDEYQDTSAAQARLLRALFGAGVDPSGMGHAVTAVGDPHQAIYGWRGASPSNILRFRTDFPTAAGQPAQLYRLSVNRRSDRTIIDLANRLAQPLRADSRLQQATADHASASEPAGGHDDLLQAADGKAAGTVQVAAFETWPQEVAWLANEVAASHDRADPPQWSQIAVLVRRNADIGLIYQELTARDVPVEIVGLDGLLNLPGIIDVVDTLRLIADVTVNPSVTNLLSGPRWRIGPRDLALLGSEASVGHSMRSAATDLDDALRIAVSTTDPSEVRCLYDALGVGNDIGLSAEGASRVAAFRVELDALRAHRDEPVLDLVHRVIRTLGVVGQLLASPNGEDQLRQLNRFLEHVADFTERDSEATLTGLLAWFDAELRHGVGLDQSVISSHDSVKLLTIHRAKGLEYDLVFVPAVVAGTFPRVQVNDNWVTSAQTVPAELRGDAEWVPQLSEVTKQAMDQLISDLKQEAQLSEDRLAYVAVTRARHRLVLTAHQWKLGAARAVATSQYFEQARDLVQPLGGVLAELPAMVDRPEALRDQSVQWPEPVDEQWRQEQLWVAAQVDETLAVSSSHADDGLASSRSAGQKTDRELSFEDAELVEIWRQQADLLLAEARERREPGSAGEPPASLSVSSVMAAVRDPDAFAVQLTRPMPRPISKVASVGTRFHAWLEERFGLQGSFDELLAAETSELDEQVADLEFRRLCRAFERGQFAERIPLAVERDFVLVLNDPELGADELPGPDQQLLVRGRIDAIYPAEGEHDYLIIDWKTSNAPADPLQLSMYRLAWSQIMSVEPQRVDVAFYHVAADRIERPRKLPDATRLWGLLLN